MTTGTWVLKMASAIAVVGTFFAAQSIAAEATGHINPLVQKFAAGESVAAPDDWVFLDYEHNPYLLDKISSDLEIIATRRKPDGQFQAAPIVRIPIEGDQDSRWMVKQLLDLGVFGIIFPRMESRAQVERAIASMRYPSVKGAPYQKPAGMRGMGPTNAAKYWGLSIPEYVKHADVWPINPQGDLIALVLIESAEGLKNVDEIVGTPGVGGVLVGAFDLSMSLGLGLPASSKPSPEIEAAIQTVLKACKKHNVACFGGGGTPEEIKRRLDQGFKSVTKSYGVNAIPRSSLDR